jgi:hypothetical protein
MAVNENDLELLQAYLDGEMPMSECEGLWRRLAVEQALAAELDQMRAEVATRQVVWTSLEPGDSALAELEKNILRGARKQNLRSMSNRAFKGLATVAACLLFGFGIGWWGRDKYPALNIENHLAVHDPNPGSTAGFGSGIQSPFATAPTTGKFMVNIRDASGKLIASPQFNTYDEARQFADDFAKQQAARMESRDVPAAPSTSEKF